MPREACPLVSNCSGVNCDFPFTEAVVNGLRHFRDLSGTEISTPLSVSVQAYFPYGLSSEQVFTWVLPGNIWWGRNTESYEIINTIQPQVAASALDLDRVNGTGS